MAAVRKAVACLVSGGASGLGLATAQRLVKNGCRVVIADLPSSKGDRVARDLGESCIFVPTDVSERDVKCLRRRDGVYKLIKIRRNHTTYAVRRVCVGHGMKNASGASCADTLSHFNLKACVPFSKVHLPS